MTLLHSTLLYHGSILLCLTLHYYKMALLDSILDSTILYHGSTSLYMTIHYSTMTLHLSTWLFNTLPWLYFILLDSTLLYPDSTSLYSIFDSTLFYHGSTSLYLTLHYSIPWLYACIILPSTLLYHGSTSLHLTLLYSTKGSTWLYYSTMVLLFSTWLLNTLTWPYFITLDSTSLHLTLHYSIPWLLLYFILLVSTLLCNSSTSLYLTLPWLYTSINLTLH